MSQDRTTIAHPPFAAFKSILVFVTLPWPTPAGNRAPVADKFPVLQPTNPRAPSPPASPPKEIRNFPNVCSSKSVKIPSQSFTVRSHVRSLCIRPASGSAVRLMPSGPKSSRSASPSRSESSRRGPDTATPFIKVAVSSSRGDQSQSSDGQLDNSTPPRLSLNHLKQGESHQRIRHGAKQLLRLTEKYPGYNGPGPEGGYETANDRALPSDGDIRAMTRLSHGIARDISEIMALRKDDPGQHKRKGSERHVGVGPSASQAGMADYASTTGRNKNRRKLDFTCHRCHRVDTPEWRPGPDGPSTLCNVCGLIYAKRERKKEESTMPTFGSPNLS